VSVKMMCPLTLKKGLAKTWGVRCVSAYLEGLELIAEANRIFGFGNWSRETVIIEPLHDPKLVPDEEDASKAKVVAAAALRHPLRGIVHHVFL
jgi:recombination DNA repair RAD52 pathway protein